MQHLIGVALSNAVVASVLALIAWSLSRCFKCPRCGHVLWILVLAKLITPPLFDLPLPLLPATSEVSAEQVANPEAVASAPTAEELSNNARNELVVARQAQLTNQQSTTSSFRNPISWLLAIWAVGALLYGAYQLYVTIQMGRLMRMATPHPRVDRAMHRIARKAKVKNYPTARVVPWVGSPMLWGMGGTSVIVIPEGLFASISDESADTLLQHELAHFQRGDQWVRILEAVTSTLFWWHPVVWVAKGEIEVFEEQCCDAWVVRHDHANRRRYAEALLDTVDFIAEAPDNAMPLAASGLGRVPLLKQRLKTIMKGDVPQMGFGGKAVLLIILLLLPLRPNLVQANFAASQKPTSSSPQATMGMPLVPEPPQEDFRPVTEVEYALAGATYGRYELIATTGYNVALRDVVTQKTVSLKQYRISCAAFAPATSDAEGTQQFAAGCEDGSVLLFDCETGNVVRELGRYERPIHSICYSPTGHELVIGGKAGLLMMFDFRSNEMKRLPVSLDAIRCVRFSPSGDQLAVTEETSWNDQPAGRIEVWQLDSWRLRRRFRCPQAVGVAEFHLDGILSADWDGTIRFWNGSQSIQVAKLAKDLVSAASFSPNALSLSELISEER